MSVTTRSFLSLLAASALLLQSSNSIGAVIVTEYFYNLNGSESGDQEWIEITNTGNTTVDLTDWSYGDSQDDVYTGPFPAGTELLAGESAIVVAQSEATFQGIWGTGIKVITATPGISLSNSASATNETIVIRDASEAIVDAANYEVSSNGWPSGNGASIYLLPGAFTAEANDIGTNWATSVVGIHGAYTALTVNPDIGNATVPDVASPGIAVPEPVSLGLFGIATVAGGFVRRRRSL